MPAHYAHYRFGCRVIPALPGELRAAVDRRRSLFDLGLQGPDPFFYHSYVSRTPLCDLGYRFHSMSGREFFRQCCDRLRRAPSEEGRVYLTGVLAHYCLDARCHPFVNDRTEAGVSSHFAIEAEFDRFLMEADGLKPARRRFRTPIALSRKDAPVVAGLYGDVQPRQLRKSVRNMAFAARMLSLPGKPSQALVRRVLHTSHYRDMQLTERKNHRCAHLNGPLLERFNLALADYPGCLQQLAEHMHTGTSLDGRFSPVFG